MALETQLHRRDLLGLGITIPEISVVYYFHTSVSQPPPIVHQESFKCHQEGA